MNPRQLAKTIAAGRVLIGALLLAKPEVLSAWVGREARRPGAQVLGRTLGARDLVLGAGTLASSADGLPVWLAAAAGADASDFVVTLRADDSLPLSGRLLVGGSALGGAVLGVLALADARR